MKVNTNQKFTAVPADAKLPTKYGEFRIRSYVDPTDGSEHAAIYLGDMNNQSPRSFVFTRNVLLETLLEVSVAIVAHNFSKP